jgi:hypothetical protein
MIVKCSHIFFVFQVIGQRNCVSKLKVIIKVTCVSLSYSGGNLVNNEINGAICKCESIITTLIMLHLNLATCQKVRWLKRIIIDFNFSF